MMQATFQDHGYGYYAVRIVLPDASGEPVECEAAFAAQKPSLENAGIISLSRPDGAPLRMPVIKHRTPDGDMMELTQHTDNPDVLKLYRRARKLCNSGHCPGDGTPITFL